MVTADAHVIADRAAVVARPDRAHATPGALRPETP
jgi:hypothetical protein